MTILAERIAHDGVRWQARWRLHLGAIVEHEAPTCA